MKAAKRKEERINFCDKAAKYPGNSIDLHDYHAWCVDKNGDVCNYSNEILMKSVEHPSLEVIHWPFTAHIIPKNGSSYARINIIYIYKMWWTLIVEEI